MPCACSVPMPDFPTNCEWGPILWKILHGFANKYGKLVSPMYLKDQEITWPRFINQTLHILPCKECREHYKEYVHANNPAILKSLSPDAQATWIQDFFFNLHNQVNARNDKPLFEKSDLQTTYESINFGYQLKHFETLIKIVFRYNEVSYMSWVHWMRSFHTLVSIYGLVQPIGG